MMITKQDTDQLDRPQAADVLGVSPRVLANLAKRKKGPPYCKYSAKMIRYTRSELMKWKQQQIVNPLAGSPDAG